ncbi:MAG: ribonuclease P protein component [Dehalococcoidia bacterium]|nr:ribonuclease P protein component [Dehalococcoidia bacterium]
MQRARRLRKSDDFALARRLGRSRVDRRLVLISRDNGTDTTRFGFSVSKRLGNAVVRNRIKRRLKSAAKEASVQEGWDLVIIARQGARAADYWSLKRSLDGLLARSGVLETNVG